MCVTDSCDELDEERACVQLLVRFNVCCNHINAGGLTDVDDANRAASVLRSLLDALALWKAAWLDNLPRRSCSWDEFVRRCQVLSGVAEQSPPVGV